MALETATYISDLIATNPTSTDLKSEGDNHIRLLKSAVKATFPAVTGAVTASHTELNFVDGVTSALQGQLDTKAPLASPALTGTPTAPTAAGGDNSTQIATTAFVANAAFSTILPSQTGNSGNLLTTDGTNPSWTAPPIASVSTVSVVTANGMAGTVANPTSTPAITLTTSVTGLVKGNGTALSAATVRTDYAEPTAALPTGLIKNTVITGAHSIAVAGVDYVAPSGALGTPVSGVATNLTGIANGLTAGNATNAVNATTATTATNATNALGIKTASTTVSVSAATAPTAGQVLKATGPTAATWQDSNTTSRVLLTSGTSWTCPANVTSINLTLIAGGGGGCRSNNTYPGCGGGGGGVVRTNGLAVVAGSSYAYAIGGGGAAGAASNTAGTAGGSTTFTGSTSATGGPGGSLTLLAVKAAGTLGGGVGLWYQGIVYSEGGGSPMGIGGVYSIGTTCAATGYGAGGYGGLSGGVAENGTNGCILIEY